ncbi:hypothetical protein COT60_01350 [Candidatus Pacearchaeota archaeon CG09_land_8_20_14_0_10_30_9]|nr:MAG: hypothetical protein QJ16_C0005G0135 [archaeon GW2011_AR1]MBS3078249.1 hypothetical protein [Candidatus Pacearchaeota archaeon]OIO40010.1 MAG: hypothetical protein AUJ61_02710 [Candidatus Pacearchaeota archaeon CG1_02_30_18]PIN71281.1 MAG: hypothetical protein COV77_02955 [Candidatus Pacearchaeota archaeon CG11_big_fil_rev_8_21_14_0_20_30_13]PIO01265.1 MAG: hypothetical protein COT60_01350 [Candidatus Pacearchaeota archaeon CG09_land_8_20_14_0_10_30_9]PIZ81956.1 MAG: hypothetical prote
MATIISDKLVRIIKNKKRLEKLLNIKITNNGREITFEGAPEEEFFATKVLDALEMGFSFSDATSIKENELEFDVINIKEFVRRGNLEKIRGRLIGKDGRVLKALSELTKCSLEMKGNEIGIIGDSENIKPAIDAIIQIIQGSKHANVYKGLEKRKEDPLLDLGLKEKKK